MSDMQIIQPAAPGGKQPPKRILAALLKQAGREEVVIAAMGKKMSYREYLAIMIWDIVTTGMMYFADGRMVQVDDFGDWLDAVKFLANHLDGPVVQGNQFTGVNIFKVYQGIDEDKV